MAAGGSRTGAGRKPGSVNKITTEIKELAQSYGPDGVARLAEISGLKIGDDGKRVESKESGTTQVAAIKELLDRGYGKARQPIDHDVSEALEELLAQLAS